MAVRLKVMLTSQAVGCLMTCWFSDDALSMTLAKNVIRMQHSEPKEKIALFQPPLQVE